MVFGAEVILVVVLEDLDWLSYVRCGCCVLMDCYGLGLCLIRSLLPPKASTSRVGKGKEGLSHSAAAVVPHGTLV